MPIGEETPSEFLNRVTPSEVCAGCPVFADCALSAVRFNDVEVVKGGMLLTQEPYNSNGLDSYSKFLNAVIFHPLATDEEIKHCKVELKSARTRESIKLKKLEEARKERERRKRERERKCKQEAKSARRGL